MFPVVHTKIGLGLTTLFILFFIRFFIFVPENLRGVWLTEALIWKTGHSTRTPEETNTPPKKKKPQSPPLLFVCLPWTKWALMVSRFKGEDLDYVFRTTKTTANTPLPAHTSLSHGAT